MRISISHKRSKEQVIQSIDKSFTDLFNGIPMVPVHFVEERRSWEGSSLSFSLLAKVGLMKVPLRGTINVTDAEVILDLDLGLLERLLPAAKVRNSLSGRIRGLLT